MEKRIITEGFAMGKKTAGRTAAVIAAVMMCAVPAYAGGEGSEGAGINRSNVNDYDDDKILYAQSDVEVRDMPSETGNIIGKIAEGQIVFVESADIETGWCGIWYNGYAEAFVDAELLFAETDSTDEYAVSDICRIDGNVDDVWRQKVNENLSVMPREILNAFTREGWELCVTDKNLDDTFFEGRYGSVMGASIYPQMKIYIEDREKAVNESPIHEIGHFIDWHLGRGTFLSNGKEFADIYESESDSFIEGLDVQCMINQNELFAEGVYDYFTNPDALEAYAPQLCRYIKKCLDTFV